MSHQPAVEWDDVAFRFENDLVLHPSTFTIKRGTCVGIMGPNGGGKTTLLRLLLGFLSPTQGSLRVLGTTPIKARQRVGYVPQFLRSDREFPITVQEIIELGCLRCPEKRADALRWMEQLGLTTHKDKVLRNLSGGLLQRALVARALIAAPELLLLDEPTANIDPPSSIAILDFLQTLRGKTTILLVTHDVKTIVERVDQILCAQGTVSSYKPSEVCEHFAMGLYHTPLLGLPSNHWK